MKNFFRKNLLKSSKLLIIFFLSNLLIFLLFITGITLGQKDSYIKVGTLENYVKNNEEIPEELIKDLKKEHCFYFLLDSEGNIEKSANLPANLNHNYSRADIASFSRWYLDDFPVNTAILENGEILVLGYPHNSIAKYSFTLPLVTVIGDLIFFPLLLILNLALFLFFQWRDSYKLRNEIVPVLEGIHTISTGKTVYLEEKGELAQIKGSLNKTSNDLQQKEEARIKWISDISHDIRTPLTVIATTSELIRTKKNAKDIDRINFNIIKLRTLIENLNLLNKLNYSLLPLKNEEYNIEELLKSTLIDFINENDLNSFPIEYLSNINNEVFTLNIDEQLFKRVISNLLTNCIIHNPEGTKITVKLYTEDNNLYLKISNPLKTFVDVNKSNSNYFSKHGNGLEFVRRFAEIYNFDLYINSKENFSVILKLL